LVPELEVGSGWKPDIGSDLPLPKAFKDAILFSNRAGKLANVGSQDGPELLRRHSRCEGAMEAFVSYTRRDDKVFRITSLAQAIKLGVQVTTGDESFKVFLDIDGIEFGQKWKEKLDEVLSSAILFIPIITPLFFASAACRDELQKFIRHEKDLGRNDLILPIYLVDITSLEKPDQADTDALAQEIRALILEIMSRQLRDWRSNARRPVTSSKVRKDVLSLSAEIAQAVNRAKTIDLSPKLNRSRDMQFRQGTEIIVKDEEAGTSNASGPKLVLWVDDIPDNNIHERAAFEKYNVRFVLATSTEDAMRGIRTGAPFDAIISDMGRPPDPRAGYTLLKEVRDKEVRDSKSKVPYFIYAGSRAPAHQREAKARGAQGTTNIGSELIDMVLRSFEPTPVGVDKSKPPANLNPVTLHMDFDEKKFQENQTKIMKISADTPAIVSSRDLTVSNNWLCFSRVQ
jgi:CheY-like chemotaxis protein